MPFKFQPLMDTCRRRFKSVVQTQRQQLNCFPHKNPVSQISFLLTIEYYKSRSIHSVIDSDHQSAIFVQNVLKHRREKPVEEVELALNRCGLILSDDFVLDILQRHRSDWRPAYVFFNWVSKQDVQSGFSPGSVLYNQILDILGAMHRFEELHQVLDEMSKRKKGLINEETYSILLNRFAAAHRVEEAIDIFNKREDFGLQLDLVAFQTLLMWLCRYKHVEAAETLFHLKLNDLLFPDDTKTRNIILNGWCVLGNVQEAKRFWKDIIQSKCKPDIFTYGTFINSLTKKGKLGTALKLFRTMWDKGLDPDVVICNNIIDALCFKKRIPEALEIFSEMNGRGVSPNAATYNSLIKHLCKIRRIEKVYELLDEMEEKMGSCLPNLVTFSYLLKCLKRPEEVANVLERMEKNGCKMGSDVYNLVLRLYMAWGDDERVGFIWSEMVKNGLGPDRRSYTIMIHGFYDKGRYEEALRYVKEMKSKGILPEPRTDILVNDMIIKVEDRRNTLHR